MTRFKTEKEFQDFLDNSLACLCGRLLTGLHESRCRKISLEWIRLKKQSKEAKQ